MLSSSEARVSEIEAALSEVVETHHRGLWGLCYRMTGSAADADEIVQDAYARVLERPPPDLTRPLWPWVRRIAMNLSRDRLRKRRSTEYVGEWLPQPIETAELDDPALPDARYSMMESVTMAFLVALEALTPKQRGVLLLRDVFDLSTAETAEALELGASDVKVSLHRARRAMDAYEGGAPDPIAKGKARDALMRFLSAVGRDDTDAVAALLHDEIVMKSDGGGEFHAARKPILGVKRVATFYRKTRPNVPIQARVTELNGWPAILIALQGARPGVPPRSAIVVEPAEDGRIRRLYAVSATPKIAALFS